MSLYRITLSEDSSANWKSKHQITSDVWVQRTYRWGSFWGILNLKTREWQVETREQIFSPSQIHPYVLEKIQRHDIQAPPPHVDDIWEEEILTAEKANWNGGLVTVCLSGSELRQWCKKENLNIPDCLSEEIEYIQESIPKPVQKSFHKFTHKHSSQNNQHQSFPKQYPKKCYIED